VAVLLVVSQLHTSETRQQAATSTVARVLMAAWWANDRRLDTSRRAG
jgi:hypothetical protein